MFQSVDLPVILAAAFVATASPGPATLALAGTAMAGGRARGLALAAGITSGSLAWSTVAALGFGAAMFAHAWIVEAIRYAGAGYLLFLAARSAASAMRRDPASAPPAAGASLAAVYMKGLLLHLTNPKAVLFFGSLYAIGVPAGTEGSVLAGIVLVVGLQSVVVFHGYALLFSSPPLARTYLRLRRWLEGAFAAAFTLAGLKILTAEMR